MIPESGTPAQFKKIVLETCSQLPQVGEVYNIAGLFPFYNDWIVIQSDQAWLTLRTEFGFTEVRLEILDWEWLKRKGLTFVRNASNDP